jgi:hypothetical protein
MKKRILLLTAAVVAVAVGVVGMSAFEAHVINVTAQIENALSVSPYEIEFGTVFPQEYLEESLTIALSGSFMAEDRVDDVDYFIRQKPKPLDSADAQLCHNLLPVESYDPNNSAWTTYLAKCYYPLCSYLSKHPDEEPANDGSLDAFHEMGMDVAGRLAKSEGDEVDIWTIDLDVPCFEGMCAQDWNHPDWELHPALESQMFGCDLWVEVTGISQALILENKTADWGIIGGDNTQGILSYNASGETFDYNFTAQGLVDGEYALIYYADYEDRYNQWGGDNPGAVIGIGTTDGSGNLVMSGSPDLGIDLPDPQDANSDISNHNYCGAPDNYAHCTGAKIWLVPTSDLTGGNVLPLTAWNPSSYLFETDLITYDDTGI